MPTAKQCPAKLLDQGRVTIDASVRRDLGLERGNFVLLQVEPLEGDSE
jgi:bifunctional DNA-binding transcriptional regulator/antitoxin component of YhaV-PrlF toxin-antitoxin module